MTKTRILKILSLFLVAVMLLSMFVSCKQGEQGPKGEQGIQGEKGEKGDKGDTGMMGAQGPQGLQGAQGEKGEKGEDGADGVDGLTPYIGRNGNWFIGETDTRIKAKGSEGEAPYIKNNYWYVDGKKTDVYAAGQNGRPGDDGMIGFFATNEAELRAASKVDNACIVLLNDILTDTPYTKPAGVTIKGDYTISVDPFKNPNKDGEYEISTAAQLFAVAKEVNENNNALAGMTIKLMNDIDLKNADWEPIGQTGATQFKGIFDGNGCTIYNLKVDSSAEEGGDYSSGLFGWIECHDPDNATTIKNLTVDGATISGHHNVAVIAGRIGGNALIENCHVKRATVENTHFDNNACGDKAGCITGLASDAGVVKGCTAMNSTVKGGRDAGQIVGSGITGNCTVENCSADNVIVIATGDCTGKNVNEAVIGRTTA